MKVKESFDTLWQVQRGLLKGLKDKLQSYFRGCERGTPLFFKRLRLAGLVVAVVTFRLGSVLEGLGFNGG